MCAYHQKVCVIVAIISSSVFSMSAPAQVEIEEIVVSSSPIRDSQLAALQAKRNANNLMDVVSADTIGRFPDQNLADSLGRLPGLAIERDQGQARFINLRGAPFRYTSIAFDGINVPGADNGRVPRFDSFPSVITSKLEANKAVLPSMTGESVAGYININTFSPFDSDGWTAAVDGGLGEQRLGGGDIEKVGLRTSWSGENFGFTAFYSENSREQITDNREYDLETDPSSGQPIVNELDFRSYIVKREDRAQGGRFEWRGDGQIERVFISTLYSEFIDNEQRNQYMFGMGGDAGATGFTGGTLTTQLLEYGKYDNSTDTTTLGLDFGLGDWNAELRYNFTKTESNVFLPITRDIGLSSTSYDITNLEDPIVNVFQLGTQEPIDPALIDYSIRNLGILYALKMDADATKFKFDADRETTMFGRDATVQVGFQSDSREADGYTNLGIGLSPRGGGVDVEAFNTGAPWQAMTTNSIGGTYYDNPGLRNAWEASPVWTVPSPPNDELVLIEEEVLSLYGMSTVAYDWGNMVFGVRVEHTDHTSTGTNDGVPVSISGDFTNFLPSVHLNFDLSEDLKWRVSASTGLSRPTYGEWRASASVDVVERTVSGGNPALQAEETFGFDTSLEWYFAPVSILSAGVFHRNIDNVIYNDKTFVDGGLYLPSATGEVWEYNGSVNGKEGRLSGIELNLIHDASDILPVPFDGLGLSGNITVLDSEFKGIDGREYGLPGTSDLIYNGSIFYENFGISARLNYQYRDQWISPLESPDEVWGEQKRLDFSASYVLPLNLENSEISIYLNANNLTDEVDLRFAGNGTLNQRESYGRRYLLGFRLNF